MIFKFMNRSPQSLISVLEETLELLSLKENDFVWSHWDNAEQAKAEIREHIVKLQDENYSGVKDLSLLFAPTGSIQEVSVSSGWGNRFLKLADKFDRAAAKLGIKQ
jgi:hypothetical protein